MAWAGCKVAAARDERSAHLQGRGSLEDASLQQASPSRRHKRAANTHLNTKRVVAVCVKAGDGRGWGPTGHGRLQLAGYSVVAGGQAELAQALKARQLQRAGQWGGAGLGAGKRVATRFERQRGELREARNGAQQGGRQRLRAAARRLQARQLAQRLFKQSRGAGGQLLQAQLEAAQLLLHARQRSSHGLGQQLDFETQIPQQCASAAGLPPGGWLACPTGPRIGRPWRPAQGG